jgi:hypothetical protein
MSDPLVIPWVNWAHKASWVAPSELPFGIKPEIFGERILGTDARVDNILDIVILDLDRRRLRSWGAPFINTPGKACAPNDESTCPRDSLAMKAYVKTTLTLEGSFDRVWIGDEHGGSYIL